MESTQSSRVENCEIARDTLEATLNAKVVDLDEDWTGEVPFKSELVSTATGHGNVYRIRP